jgi:hypothetical protein
VWKIPQNSGFSAGQPDQGARHGPLLPSEFKVNQLPVRLCAQLGNHVPLQPTPS